MAKRNRTVTVAHKSGYLPTLDGWRAIAIAAVLLDHGLGYPKLGHYPKLMRFTHAGPNGVSLFFAISGFLICSRLLEEHRAHGKINLGGFYVRRACRILPPALFYLIAIGILSFCGLILVSPWEWCSSLFFFRNYLPPSLIREGWGGYTVHYWSLAVEEHFYLLWPAVLVFVGKARARWVALSGAIFVGLWRTWDLHHQSFNRWIPGLLFGCRTDVRLDALLIGCLAALLLDDGSIRTAFSKSFKPWMWWLCVAGYLAIQVAYLSRQSRGYSLAESSLLPLVIAGTVYGPTTLVTIFLELPFMKWIGRLSYSLYLWQQLFTVSVPAFSILRRPLFGMGMTFLCAWLSYRFIERPFIRWGHHLAPPPTEGRDDLAWPRGLGQPGQDKGNDGTELVAL